MPRANTPLETRPPVVDELNQSYSMGRRGGEEVIDTSQCSSSTRFPPFFYQQAATYKKKSKKDVKQYLLDECKKDIKIRLDEIIFKSNEHITLNNLGNSYKMYDVFIDCNVYPTMVKEVFRDIIEPLLKEINFYIDSAYEFNKLNYDVRHKIENLSNEKRITAPWYTRTTISEKDDEDDEDDEDDDVRHKIENYSAGGTRKRGTRKRGTRKRGTRKRGTRKQKRKRKSKRRKSKRKRKSKRRKYIKSYN